MVQHVFKRLRRDDRGSTLIFAGAAAAVLVATAGLTVDLTRVYGVKDELQQGIDAAALAAGQVASGNEADVVQEANAIFTANWDPDAYTTLVAPGLGVAVLGDGERVALDATARIDTLLLGLLGFDHFEVGASATVERVVRPTEVSLVLDVTGSMKSGNKIGALRDAAVSLVDLLYGDVSVHPHLYMSIVPYTSAVNIGPDKTAWLAGFDAGAYDDDPQGWKGCVEARPDGGDLTDDPPGVQAFPPFLYETDIDNVYPPVHAEQSWENDGTGPNLGCGPEILPLTNVKQTVRDKILGLLQWHRGGTTSNLGMAWGWRSISPRWKGLWGLADRPLDYGVDDTRKVVVILTDGINQFWPNLTKSGEGESPGGSDYTGHGRLADLSEETGGEVQTLDDGVDELNDRFTTICNAMKANEIDVFTITFGLTKASHEGTKDVFRNCASKPEYYFDSPTTGELETVFRKVGVKLSALRLVE